MNGETVLKRLNDAASLLDQARPRIPLAVSRLYNDYLPGFPTGADPAGGTLIDPHHPELGSVTLTQPERFAVQHDEASQARRMIEHAVQDYFRAAATLADIGAVYGTYVLAGRRLDPHELEQLYCSSCARVGVRTKRPPHRRLCSWCDLWNRRSNLERIAQGKPVGKMPPIGLLRLRHRSRAGRVSDRDMRAAVTAEKRPKKRRSATASLASPLISDDAQPNE